MCGSDPEHGPWRSDTRRRAKLRPKRPAPQFLPGIGRAFPRRPPPFSASGWVHCREAACELELILRKAAEIRRDAQVFVLVGVGGSNQAARAMIEALKAPGGPEIVYAGNTLSAHYLQDVLRRIEGEKRLSERDRQEF